MTKFDQIAAGAIYAFWELNKTPEGRKWLQENYYAKLQEQLDRPSPIVEWMKKLKEQE